MESGWRVVGQGELAALASTYGIDVTELLPARTPVVVDPVAGTLQTNGTSPRSAARPTRWRPTSP
jgi:hypothetical protein